jgi:hypothetical protein
MPTKPMLIVAGVLMCQPASASGGLDCSAEGDVTIEISGGVTHGMGGPLFNAFDMTEANGGEGITVVRDGDIACSVE